MKKEGRTILDKYLKTYNDATDKVQAIATLITLREGQENFFNSISDNIDHLVKKDVHPLEDVFLKERIFLLIETVRFGAPVMIDKKGRYMSGGYEAAILEFKGEDEEKIDYHAIEEIAKYCSIEFHISVHKAWTSAIIEAAILKDYPQKLFQKDVKAHNYAGPLSEECIEDLQTFRKEKPQMPVNDFFITAWNRFDSCRESADGIKINWTTLKSRIKESYPDIYKREKKKNF